MFRLMTILGMGLLLQACAADPKHNDSNTSTASYSDRFSIEAIKKRKEQEYANKLKVLTSKGPSDELKNALRNNDLYLLGHYTGKGGNFTLPGLIEPRVTMVNCRIKQLDGFGDSIYGANHAKYRNEMIRYASEFNRGMISYCR